MKNLLIIATIGILSTSCGVVEKLDKNCGSDIEMGCNFVFGTKSKDQDNKIKDLENKDIEIEKKNQEQDNRLDYLQNQNNNLINSMNSLSYDIDENSTEINSINILLESIENKVNANILEIASFGNVINKMIDPCGNSIGYDEIILKTKDGQYLAYFENGSRRFLTKLEYGNYMTTDGTNCSFSLDANGITWAGMNIPQ